MNRFIIAFKKIVTQKLTIAPAVASVIVLNKSALLIFANMLSNVPTAVPAFVVLSK